MTAFGLFVGLVVMGGRIATAHQSVQTAAYDAARAASISRTRSQAARLAVTAARSSLAEQDVHCVSQTITVDTAGFRAALGLPSAVRATVTCRVGLSDLALPGVPGSRSITATVTSPIDPYRERR